MNDIISPVLPNELEEAKTRQVFVRFDCLIRMYDSGCRGTKGGLLAVSKSLPPQWFKSEQKITLDGIKFADPYTLGMMTKEQFFKLEKAIEQYEDNNIS